MSEERVREIEAGPVSYKATEAQNQFGRLLQRVGRGEAVYITRYGQTEAVLISARRYRELSGEAAPDLARLTREFDARLERMQTDEAAAGFDALFDMDGAELGKSAVEAAHKKDS